MNARDKLSKSVGPETSTGQNGSKELDGAANARLEDAAHDRTYNPVDSAQRGSIGSALNSDAARYKKGPGPV